MDITVIGSQDSLFFLIFSCFLAVVYILMVVLKVSFLDILNHDFYIVLILL